jgi:transcriptional regulator with XRE-family HTH domain
MGPIYQTRVRELREAVGLTQEELAKETGLSRQTIIIWEGASYEEGNPKVLSQPQYRTVQLLKDYFENLLGGEVSILEEV